MSYPLLTQRLNIQPLSMPDLEAFVEYRQDPGVARYQSWETSYSSNQAKELIESQQGVLLPEKNNWLQLAINLQVSGELIGDLAIHRLKDEEISFELGFTLARKFQGQGFAREAVLAMMNYLFTEVGATRLEASTDQRNTRSIQLLEAVGFNHEPSRTFTEEFKGEVVTVDQFQIISSVLE